MHRISSGREIIVLFSFLGIIYIFYFYSNLRELCLINFAWRNFPSRFCFLFPCTQLLGILNCTLYFHRRLYTQNWTCLRLISSLKQKLLEQNHLLTLEKFSHTSFSYLHLIISSWLFFAYSIAWILLKGSKKLNITSRESICDFR